MKTIGVLGGLGPQATIDFEARVHRAAQQLIAQAANTGYPPMVVYYFRESPVIMPADGSMPATRPPVNPTLLDAARTLGACADFLVITSNGVHAYQQEIEQASGRPVVSMIDATMAEVQRRRPAHLGLIDFRPVSHGVYTAPLNQLDVPWDAIASDMLRPLQEAVFAIDEGRTAAEVGGPARAALAYLRGRQVDGIILACTEIPLMLPEAAEDPDLINPAQCLAEAAVRYALS